MHRVASVAALFRRCLRALVAPRRVPELRSRSMSLRHPKYVKIGLTVRLARETFLARKRVAHKSDTYSLSSCEQTR
jgi:hypothetical protein